MTVHYFVRHVVSEFNIERRLGGDSPIHHKYGRIQLDELFHFFSGLWPHVTIDTIFTSPLKRCDQTARALARDLEKFYGMQIEIVADDALIEQNFGVKEGSVYKDQDSNVGKLYDNNFKGADRPDDMIRKVTPFVSKIDKKITPSIVVGHNLNLRTISSVAVPESSGSHYVMKWKNADVYAYNNTNPNSPVFQPVYIAHTFEPKELRELRIRESQKTPSQRIREKRHSESSKKKPSKARGGRSRR